MKENEEEQQEEQESLNADSDLESFRELLDESVPHLNDFQDSDHL